MALKIAFFIFFLYAIIYVICRCYTPPGEWTTFVEAMITPLILMLSVTEARQRSLSQKKEENTQLPPYKMPESIVREITKNIILFFALTSYIAWLFAPLHEWTSFVGAMSIPLVIIGVTLIAI